MFTTCTNYGIRLRATIARVQHALTLGAVMVVVSLRTRQDKRGGLDAQDGRGQCQRMGRAEPHQTPADPS